MYGSLAMMREDIRKERVKKYGSFLYCTHRDTICSYMDNELAICPRADCILDDPGYIALQERIAKNRLKNSRQTEKEELYPARKEQKPKPMTRREYLLEQIKRKEELSERLYRENKPKAADMVFRQAQIMKGELQK